MNFLDLCRRRQSCRRYDPRPIPREAVERCLEAARLAPSACNSQPWTFLVVDDPALRARVAAAAFGGIYAMNRFAADAPALVVIVTERSRYAARLGGQFRGVRYSLIDLGIAGEHFILQATEEGLGTCWLGWFDETAVKKVLGLPRSAKVDVIVSVGRAAADDRLREKNRKSLDEIRSFPV